MPSQINRSLEEVSQGLQDNAYEFVEKGLRYIIEDEEREYKYAMMHIYTGTLLFLKDLLFQEHWSLVFQKVDDANKEKLFNGELNSVDFTTLLKRLENLANLDINEKLQKHLEWMRKRRNETEHFYNELNFHEVKAKIAELLIEFINLIKQLQKLDDDYDISTLSELKYEPFFEMIQDYSLKFERYITMRNSKIRGKLASNILIIRCPKCNQSALEVDSEVHKTYCHFCLEELSFDMFFAKHSPVYFDEFDINDKIEKCPDCHETLLFEYDDKTVCLGCQIIYNTFELTNCLKCDDKIVGEGVCDSCLEYLMSE